jgi:aspartate oxidase
MTNDRLDRIEATLERMASQAEMDRQDFRERMGQMQQQAEADRQRATEERQQLRENLATLNEITIDFMGVTREAIARLDQAIAELRAANQRQERINDFLLRERGLS